MFQSILVFAVITAVSAQKECSVTHNRISGDCSALSTRIRVDPDGDLAFNVSLSSDAAPADLFMLALTVGGKRWDFVVDREEGRVFFGLPDKYLTERYARLFSPMRIEVQRNPTRGHLMVFSDLEAFWMILRIEDFQYHTQRDGPKGRIWALDWDIQFKQSVNFGTGVEFLFTDGAQIDRAAAKSCGDLRNTRRCHRIGSLGEPRNLPTD